MDEALATIIADAAEVPGVCGILDRAGHLQLQTWAQPHWITSDGHRVTVTRWQATDEGECWIVVESEHRVRIDRLVPAEQS